MTLRERAREISLRHHVSITAATLFRYYIEAGITYKTVDLFSTNKLIKASVIRVQQQRFL